MGYHPILPESSDEAASVRVGFVYRSLHKWFGKLNLIRYIYLINCEVKNEIHRQNQMENF
jgi:hypothetical protein